ncbi:unnamed protein product [Didymodactylos carnosus]|uniref:Uncharacterized protein n=1 Tax=Didymodactylos carnosus TaxID=1234261 RepID=A0A813RE06_9BILA|nr:unnamed protein product [Didymodactylos carnosus]CAF0807967.1 unnamed protein product [Didymodactylos carnosus]CAF3562765.1 unnamed protein product [Didymodactylos carnosus]CAF3591708.1 unnamed protein product [Didymodactylos carnosus]
MMELSRPISRVDVCDFNDIRHHVLSSSSNNLYRINNDSTINNVFLYTKQTPMTYKDLRMFMTNKLPSNIMILPSYSVNKRRSRSRTSNNSSVLKDHDDLTRLDVKTFYERKKTNEVYHKILSRRSNSTLVHSDSRCSITSSNTPNDDMIIHQFYDFDSNPNKRTVYNDYSSIIKNGKSSSKLKNRQIQSPLISSELFLPHINDDENTSLRIQHSQKLYNRNMTPITPTSNNMSVLRFEASQKHQRGQITKEKQVSSSAFELAHPNTPVGSNENSRIKMICESTQITSSLLPDGRKIKLLDVYMPKMSF